ncbi:MAG: hypothetical protein AAFX79_03385 [Planctomycetota bacterium]
MADLVFAVGVWALLATAAVLLAWATLWDRPRGRRRCPKCWYELVGITASEGGTACPECGRVTRRDRALRKTRRHWWSAALACVLLVGSYASWAYPIVRDHGWWRIAPDLVLVAMLPWMDEFTEGYSTSDVVGNDMWHEVLERRYGRWDDDRGGHWPDGLWLHERLLLRVTSRSLLERTDEWQFRKQAAYLLAGSGATFPNDIDRGLMPWVITEYARHAYVASDAWIVYGAEYVPHDAEYHNQPTFDVALFFAAFEDGTCVRSEQDAYGARIVWMPGRAGGGRQWTIPVKPTTNGAPVGIHGAPWWRYAIDPHPGTLIPDEDGLSSFGPIGEWRMDFATYVGFEQVNGRPCHVVRSGDFGDFELWIDAETYRIRKYCRGDAIYLYEGSDDSVIDPAWSRFDPSDPTPTPLEERLDEVNALKPEVDLLEYFEPRPTVFDDPGKGG